MNAFTFQGESYEVGDIIRVTRHEQITIEGPVLGTTGAKDALWLGEGTIYGNKSVPITVDFITKITLIKRFHKPLPTVPGVYIAAGFPPENAVIFKLKSHGWTDAEGSELSKAETKKLHRINDGAGLVRLERKADKGLSLEKRNGIFIYHSYGLDSDGQLSEFPNLVLKNHKGWFVLGNTFDWKPQKISHEEVLQIKDLRRLTLE